MTFDPNFRCRTRAGRDVEILVILPPEKATEGGERIVALVNGYNNLGPTIETYRIDGRYSSDRETLWDLVNTPTVVTAKEYADLIEREDWRK